LLLLGEQATVAGVISAVSQYAATAGNINADLSNLGELLNAFRIAGLL
jgi:hypothetical protein